jgi:hypothetical protein
VRSLQTLLALDTADFGGLLVTCAARPHVDVLRLSACHVAASLAGLTQGVPTGTDVSQLVAAYPALLLVPKPSGSVAAAVEALKDAAPRGVDVEALAMDMPSAFGELLGEFLECGHRLEEVDPLLRAWLCGSLGVR